MRSRWAAARTGASCTTGTRSRCARRTRGSTTSWRSATGSTRPGSSPTHTWTGSSAPDGQASSDGLRACPQALGRATRLRRSAFAGAAFLAGVAFLAAVFFAGGLLGRGRPVFLAAPSSPARPSSPPPSSAAPDPWPASRRASRTPARRSAPPGVCPRRSDALNSPSVTYGPNRPSLITIGFSVTGSAPISRSGGAAARRCRVFGAASSASASSSVTVKSLSSLSSERKSSPRLTYGP